MQKLIISLLCSLLCTLSFSQSSFNNNVLIEEIPNKSNNYIGSNIKEILIKYYNSPLDTIGQILEKSLLDQKGNVILTMKTNPDGAQSKIIFKYDTINRLIGIKAIDKDTVIINKIKYNKLSQIKAYKISYSNGMFKIVNNRYNSDNFLKSQKIEIFYSYNVRFIRGDNHQTLGYGTGNDWKQFRVNYQYLKGNEIENNHKFSNNTSYAICKLDMNNNIVEFKLVNKNGIAVKEIKIVPDNYGRIAEKIIKRENASYYHLKYEYSFY
jgi:hypothetical protein